MSNNDKRRRIYPLNKIDYSEWRGVFIEDTEGELHEVTLWNNGLSFNSVVVITDEHSIGIAGDHLPICDFCEFSWSNGNAYSDAHGMYSYDDPRIHYSLDTAYLEFDGVTNTDNLQKKLTDSSLAVNKCRSYVFPNGNKGYLMAAGEYKMIADNIDEINLALSRSSKTELNVNITNSSQVGMWTSTMANGISLSTGGPSIIEWLVPYADCFQSQYAFVYDGFLSSKTTESTGFKEKWTKSGGGSYGSNMGITVESYCGCRPLCRPSFTKTL